MSSKKWSIFLLALVFVILCAIGGMTAWIDPFFHYHTPLENLQYPINNQRYQNDGIVKHFSYDALITGTSMTENFKVSEYDALFDVHSIKVPFSGATFTELNQNLQRALDANPDIKMVIYGLDSWFLLSDKDSLRTDAKYPTYLYDDDLLNDIQYLLNKEIFFSDTLGVLDYTHEGLLTTSFDDYSNWSKGYPYTAEAVVQAYNRKSKSEEVHAMTSEERALISYNMRNGILEMAYSHPQIQFYYFFPPYSCLFWDDLIQLGELESQVEAFSLASELLLEAENIHLFSFYNDYETAQNLNHYRDIVHYSEDINSMILQRMKSGEYQLTKDNYQDHWQQVLTYYQGFDFDTLLSAYSGNEP